MTVWYNGNALMICDQTAKKFGLVNHQQLQTESQFWEVLVHNCETMIEWCKAQQEIENGPVN